MAIRTSYNTWQEAMRQIATVWNSHFNGSNRLTRGADTKDDLIVDSTTEGVVLKDSNGHYWRISISTLGVLTTTDLGTTKP